jgi:protein CpxP
MRIALAVLLMGAFIGPVPAAAQNRRPDPPPPPPRDQAGPPGKWWDAPEMARKLSLTADQQKKMDDVFQQFRVKLIDLHAVLDREEAAFDPLWQAPQLDDSKILPQIDRIAQARADLEKTESRLLLGLRHVLTNDQWKMLDAQRPRPPRPPGPPPPRPEE